MAYEKKPSIRSASWNYGGPSWRLSRSKIDLFTQCPNCFYLDNKLGVGRPKMPSFTLNIAVDELLKREFDLHRVAKTRHPLMEQYKVDAIPFSHKDLDIWRENFKGLEYKDAKTGLTISGAIDDVWIDPKGNLMVVDYKATSKDGKIEELSDSSWEGQYKRQLEVYQWILRKMGFPVSDTGYFVYVNGRKDKKAFDGKLEFDVTLIAHKGDDSWVEGVLAKIKTVLDGDEVPAGSAACDYCMYRKFSRDVQQAHAKTKKGKE